jgi:predicted DNA-binding protein YlxM (UPF0122 family)
LIEDYTSDENIIDSYQKEFSISPEDFLIEKESRIDSVELIRFAIRHLTEIEKNILVDYVVKRMNVNEIAKKNKVHRATIYRWLEHIPKRINELYNNIATNQDKIDINMRGIFSKSLEIPNPTFEQARDYLFCTNNFTLPKITALGWPFEIAKHKFVSAGWYRSEVGKNFGRPIWRARYRCGVSDYLNRTAKDNIVCPMCRQCKGGGSRKSSVFNDKETE